MSAPKKDAADVRVTLLHLLKSTFFAFPSYTLRTLMVVIETEALDSFDGFYQSRMILKYVLQPVADCVKLFLSDDDAVQQATFRCAKDEYGPMTELNFAAVIPYFCVQVSTSAQGHSDISAATFHAVLLATFGPADEITVRDVAFVRTADQLRIDFYVAICAHLGQTALKARVVAYRICDLIDANDPSRLLVNLASEELANKMDVLRECDSVAHMRAVHALFAEEKRRRLHVAHTPMKAITVRLPPDPEDFSTWL